MSTYEVPEPILNSPYEAPQAYWYIEEGKPPECRPGRRPAGYFYRDPTAPHGGSEYEARGQWVELTLVNLVRQRLMEWRQHNWAGATRTTMELLNYWRRDGRAQRLFFAQLEAVETIIFLTEARADLLQGLNVPLDEPSPERQAEGFSGFKRYACKMATGTGKTTVMGMLAAWSILNKVNDKSDARFSEAVLFVCPNVTIRERLRELDPDEGEASVYLKRGAGLLHPLPAQRPDARL